MRDLGSSLREYGPRLGQLAHWLKLAEAELLTMDVRIYGRSTKSQLRQGGQTN